MRQSFVFLLALQLACNAKDESKTTEEGSGTTPPVSGANPQGQSSGAGARPSIEADDGAGTDEAAAASDGEDDDVDDDTGVISKVTPILHLAYVDATAGAVKYASDTATSGGFVSETIASGRTYSTTSLALDSQNNAHVLYVARDTSVDPDVDYLTYATNSSGAWVITEISTRVLGEPALAIDSQDVAHVAYWSSVDLLVNGQTVTEILLAHTTSGDFTDYANVEWWESGVTSVSLAIGKLDELHFLFQNGGELRHRSGVFGSYSSEFASHYTVASYTGTYRSIAVDDDDAVHIAFSDMSTAQYGRLGDSGWTLETLVEIAEPYDLDDGIGISLAVDAQGKAYVSRGGEDASVETDALVFATNADGTFAATVVKTHAPAAGFYYTVIPEDTSIALDPNGDVHISWYDTAASDLWVATNASGAWVATKVEETGDIGSHSSLAIADMRGRNNRP